jgi:hypothetical protein
MSDNTVEIAVKLALEQFKQAVAQLENDFGKATQGVGDDADEAGKKVKGIGDSATAAGGGIRSMADEIKALAPALGALAVAQQFIEANREIERARLALTQISGDSASADALLGRLADTAQRLGLDVGQANRSFVTLAASAKGKATKGSPLSNRNWALAASDTLCASSARRSAIASAAIAVLAC